MTKTVSAFFGLCFGLTVLISLTCIIGWYTNNDTLLMVFDGQIKMKFNAALGLLFASAALVMLRKGENNKGLLMAGNILAILVILLGLVTLSEYIFNINTGIDEIFFKDPQASGNNYYSGRMSVLAAVILVLIGSDLLLFNRASSALYQFYLLSLITIISLLMVIGFNFISDVPAYIRMAIHLGLAFISFSIAVWLAQPALHAHVSFQRKLNTAFIAALMLIIVITGTLLYFSGKRVDNSKWIKHTVEVIAAADKVHRKVMNIEITARTSPGFKDSSQIVQLRGEIHLVQQLTIDNRQQRMRMDSLQQIASLPYSQFITSANRGLMLRLLDDFQTEESRLMISRETENERGIRTSRFITLLLLGCVFFMVISLFFIIRHSNRIRKKSESKFKDLLETAPDAMIIANEKGLIQLINLQTENIFGYHKEELIGKPVEVLIPEAFRSKHKGHRQNFMQSSKARAMGAGLQLYAMRKDGTEFPVEISLSPIRTEGSTWVSAAVRDITERKKMEEKAQHLARLVENTSDAIFSLDPKFRIKSWNKAAEILFGYSVEEVIGKSAATITRPNLNDEERKQIREELITTGAWHGEIGFLKKNGSPVYVSVSNAINRNMKGEVEGYVTVCRDFSERKKLEDELRYMNRELEAFSYSISHDLRAPLRAVIGFTNILEMEYSSQLDDEAKRITNIIKTNTEKMGQLIDDLLAFAHLNRKELTKKQVPTLQLVKDVIQSVEQNYGSGLVRWDIAEVPDVWGDVNMLRQVWINLLSNAVKYSRGTKEPQVKINYTIEDGYVEFIVQDNGVGFDEKHADKLFKVFQRLHTSDQFEGTGVGLAIAERIITRHGGTIRGESSKGEGASFYFTIPIYENSIS